ncbi:hypothetical protein BLS_005185 [Venturia inaequalis]|uniref:Uncharacterized protein n=1 Tax=Venturia inaequalis TaxID=5025 RepID=A0A8H3YWZ1_VENIN|nr:hypothetical protein BLS_005185 [Venturia inaequalis]KAE9972837.1 hypothetical protein EG327_009358 [Venturia inaequalis]KAE9975792.1 hypothetical protein EG328_002971 [Venturia inaequalis]
MVAIMSFQQVLLYILGLASFVLAQNATTSSILSFTTSNLTTSKTDVGPSTILITSTPGGGLEIATTFITSSGYQNTTQSSSASKTSEPTFATPTVTSAVNTPNSPATSTPAVLSAAPSMTFSVLPAMGAVIAFMGAMCVLQ